MPTASNHTISSNTDEQFTLHPFDMLCFECEMSDCVPTSPKCLQKMVVQASGITKLKMTHRFSWKKKTELMIRAGLACLLGDIVDEFGMRDEVRKYKQINIDELHLNHPEKIIHKSTA